MRYKPTPLNLASVALIVWAIWTYNPQGDSEGWGTLALIILVGFGILGLGVDFVIQRISKKYLWTLFSEIIILFVLLLFNLSTERTQTLVLQKYPDERTYITIIYDVEGEPELPIHWTTWNAEFTIPKSGILLTSSDFDDYLPKTDMKYPDGRYLSDDPEIGFGRFSFDTIQLNNKNYQYRTWLIDSHCCMYSSNETKNFKNELINKFTELKNADKKR